MQSQMKVTSILGNSQKLDGGAMFGNAPRAVWQKWYPPDDLGRIDLNCRCLLLEVDDKKILLETGIGAFFDPKLADRYGVQNPDQHLLLQNLKEQGIEEDEIDVVLLSHLHFDHAGGLLRSAEERLQGNNSLHFPNATYYVGQAAWQRAQNPHARDKASFIPDLVSALKSSGRLKIIEDHRKDDALQYFDFYLSDGHTPGQYISIIKGRSRKLVFCGDLIPGKAWMHIPITMGYDRYPEMLIDEKKEIFQKLEENNDILFFTHDKDIAGSTFYKDDKGKIKSRDTFKVFKEFLI